MLSRVLLLALVLVAPALRYLIGALPLWVFATGSIGIAVLAEWIRLSTEQLALRLGPAVGSLLTVSLAASPSFCSPCSCWPRARLRPRWKASWCPTP